MTITELNYLLHRKCFILFNQPSEQSINGKLEWNNDTNCRPIYEHVHKKLKISALVSPKILLLFRKSNVTGPGENQCHVVKKTKCERFKN